MRLKVERIKARVGGPTGPLHFHPKFQPRGNAVLAKLHRHAGAALRDGNGAKPWQRLLGIVNQRNVKGRLRRNLVDIQDEFRREGQRDGLAQDAGVCVVR